MDQTAINYRANNKIGTLINIHDIFPTSPVNTLDMDRYYFGYRALLKIIEIIPVLFFYFRSGPFART